MKKIIIITGPTAIGKTSQAIKLAKQLNGEIISVDSRQIYKGMDIGTGKDIEKNSEFRIQNLELNEKIKVLLKQKVNIGTYRIDGINIWGYDLVKPDQEFSVNHWLIYVEAVVNNIIARNKLPIIVGGTGFWIQALLKPISTLGIKPNKSLRSKLNQLNLKQLQEKLLLLNSDKFKSLNKSDKHNPRRLIRAIEIALSKPNKKKSKPVLDKYNQLIIVLEASNKYLDQKINSRVKNRINQGLEKEIKSLLKSGIDWRMQSMTALGYKEWQSYFEKKETISNVIENWQDHEHAYVRRQKVWFKKFFPSSEKTFWFNVEQKGWQNHMVKLIKNWYPKNK